MTERPPVHRFLPGEVNNPKGRPKGTRNKVATAFFDNLYGVWEEQGEAVLRRAAFEKPMEFAAMVAKLMPAKLEISTPTHGLTDERFQELLDLAERQLERSASMTIEGTAVERLEGGGGPQAAGIVDVKIEAIPYSPPQANDLLTVSASEPVPDFGRATQATIISRIAELPKLSETVIVQPITSPPLDDTDEEDIDPASLF